MDSVLVTMRARLDALEVSGEILEFDEAVPTAVAAAEQLGCDVGAIANSLVFAADGEPVLVLVSGAHRADLTLVAGRIGAARVRRADPEFVLQSTGQEIGGVAPVGHPEPLPTYVDEALTGYEVVWAGAGTEHSMFATTAAELVRITGGRLISVA